MNDEHWEEFQQWYLGAMQTCYQAGKVAGMKAAAGAAGDFIDDEDFSQHPAAVAVLSFLRDGYSNAANLLSLGLEMPDPPSWMTDEDDDRA